MWRRGCAGRQANGVWGCESHPRGG
jgi:hypothetical protein